MPWVKVTDTAFDDPRLLAVPRGVRLLHFEALAWSNRYGADGLIPAHVLGRLTDEPDPADAAAQLVTAGLWEAIDAGWRIGWLREDQPSAEETAERRRQDASRQARKRRHNAGDHSTCDPERCRVLLSASRRDTPRDSDRDSRRESTPSRPDPSRPDPKRGEDGETEGATDRRPSPPSSERSASERWRCIDGRASRCRSTRAS